MSSTHDINMELVEVKKSKIRNAGLGCFARTLIPAGTLIGPYHGKRLTAKQRRRVKSGVYIWKVHDDLFIDAIRHKENNPLRYVNGAKTPLQTSRINCIVKFLGPSPSEENVYYLVTKDIHPGEELIISYGKNYFVHHPKHQKTT